MVYFLAEIGLLYLTTYTSWLKVYETEHQGGFLLRYYSMIIVSKFMLEWNEKLRVFCSE